MKKIIIALSFSSLLFSIDVTSGGGLSKDQLGIDIIHYDIRLQVDAKRKMISGYTDIKMKIIDEIIKEPAGGAHRNKDQAVLSIKEALLKYLDEFKKFSREEIFEQRKKKFLDIGKEKTFTAFSKGTSWIRNDNFFMLIKEILFKYKKRLIIVTLLTLIAFLFLF